MSPDGGRLKICPPSSGVNVVGLPTTFMRFLRVVLGVTLTIALSLSRKKCIQPPKRENSFTVSLKTEMAPDSAGVRSGLVSLSDRFESSSGICSSR